MVLSALTSTAHFFLWVSKPLIFLYSPVSNNGTNFCLLLQFGLRSYFPHVQILLSSQMWTRYNAFCGFLIIRVEPITHTRWYFLSFSKCVIYCSLASFIQKVYRHLVGYFRNSTLAIIFKWIAHRVLYCLCLTRYLVNQNTFHLPYCFFPP